MCLIVLDESRVVVWDFFLSPFEAVLTTSIHSTPWQRFLQLSNACCWKSCIWFVYFIASCLVYGQYNHPFQPTSSVLGWRILDHLVPSQVQTISHLSPLWSFAFWIYCILFRLDNQTYMQFLSHWYTLNFYQCHYNIFWFALYYLVINSKHSWNQ